MIRSPPRTARSGTPVSSPTSSDGSIRRPARSRNITLKTPHTGPHGLAEDKDGNIWFTGNHGALIGKLDPKTGIVTEYKMPDPKAKDPHTLNYRSERHPLVHGAEGQLIGRLDPEDRRDQADQVADAEARGPTGS